MANTFQDNLDENCLHVKKIIYLWGFGNANIRKYFFKNKLSFCFLPRYSHARCRTRCSSIQEVLYDKQYFSFSELQPTDLWNFWWLFQSFETCKFPNFSNEIKDVWMVQFCTFAAISHFAPQLRERSNILKRRADNTSAIYKPVVLTSTNAYEFWNLWINKLLPNLPATRVLFKKCFKREVDLECWKLIKLIIM